jgi:dienelactone hydrolase
MHAMESFLAPSPSIFTTIFYKPFWLFQVVMAAVPFLMYNGESVIKPRIVSFHEALRSDPETKSLKIGSAGFCWGGKYTILLSQEPNLIDVGFTAHPSKMKFPEDWDKVQKPLSIAIGDVDMGIKIDMVNDIKPLLEGESKPKRQNEVVIYPGAKHGFAVRAPPTDEGQTKSGVEAMKQAIAWFEKWMAWGGGFITGL